MGTLPHRPVVAVDVDGTIGMYHDHFTNFASQYLGEPVAANWSRTPDGEFSDALDMEKHVYRDIKLAYRQGGMKRSMPVWDGAKELVDSIRAEGAEVWFCTTRPWMRLDNIDPDTRHFFERNGLDFDGLIYGEDKYHDLVEIVGRDRVVAVLDDEPEQYLKAADLNLSPILRLGNHNRWFVKQEGLSAAGSLAVAKNWITIRIRRWKEEHMAAPATDIDCIHEGCTVPIPHSHADEDVNWILPHLYPKFQHQDSGRECGYHADRKMWYFQRNDIKQLLQCILDHPHVGKVISHQHDEETIKGRWCTLAGDGEWYFYSGTESYRCAMQHPVAEERTDFLESFGHPGVGSRFAGVTTGLQEMLRPGMDARDGVTHPPDVRVMDPNTHTEVLLGCEHSDSEEIKRIIHLVGEFWTLFGQKNADYQNSGGAADDLGVKGQYADMHRKFMKLRKVMWDGNNNLNFEGIDQVLMDMIGHCFLTLDMLKRDGII